MRVLGVDGCRGTRGHGWVGALLDGRRVRWLPLCSAAEILAVDAAAIGIDIPIGLPAAGPRACDRAARRRLGRAGASVFPAPLRVVLSAAGYAEACARSRAVCGRALSVQAWHLVPRIADVDAMLRPADHARVVEVHPEISFRALDAGVTDGKRTAVGMAQRLRAAASIVDDLELPHLPGVRADDALDALAVAWSARRWAAGDAEVLPCANPPRDERDRPMRIVV